MDTHFRTVAAASQAVRSMIGADVGNKRSVDFDDSSPDGDVGKFSIFGEPARAIHIFNGYHLPIRLEWFEGGVQRPEINRGDFEWYVFAVEPRRENLEPHYVIVNYRRVRQWVLEFDAPLGRNWRDQNHWMATIRSFSDGTAYFRWGDEPRNDYSKPSRFLELDNVLKVAPGATERTPDFALNGEGGESPEHEALKKYVAGHPELFGLDRSARPSVEYLYITGDRVDVLFEGGGREVTVIEVELSGASHLMIGVHQAIKYRALSAAERDIPNVGPGTRVQAFVAAFKARYPETVGVARRYEVGLVEIDPAELQLSLR